MQRYVLFFSSSHHIAPNVHYLTFYPQYFVVFYIFAKSDETYCWDLPQLSYIHYHILSNQSTQRIHSNSVVNMSAIMYKQLQGTTNMKVEQKYKKPQPYQTKHGCHSKKMFGAINTINAYIVATIKSTKNLFIY